MLTGGLNVFRQQQFERLRVLAKNSAACTESLTTKLQKAEDILILAGMCRKMETEQEKVLPFYSQAVPDEAELSAELAEEQRRFREEQGSKVRAVACLSLFIAFLCPFVRCFCLRYGAPRCCCHCVV